MAAQQSGGAICFARDRDARRDPRLLDCRLESLLKQLGRGRVDGAHAQLVTSRDQLGHERLHPLLPAARRSFEHEHGAGSPRLGRERHREQVSG